MTFTSSSTVFAFPDTYDVKRTRTKRLYLCTKFRTTYKNDNKCVALHMCKRLHAFLKFGKIRNERRTDCIIICLNMVRDRRLRLKEFYGICLYVKSAINQTFVQWVYVFSIQQK